MPTIKNFEDKAKKQKKSKQDKSESPDFDLETHPPKASHKRRPGRESEEDTSSASQLELEATVQPAKAKSEDVTFVKTDHLGATGETTENKTEGASQAGDSVNSEFSDSTFESASKKESLSEPPPVHIEFFGSEMLRAQVPKAFDIAEAVATDWQRNGDFSQIPVGHPLAQALVQQGLSRAKNVEKKLDDLGVIPMAKMGFEFLKSKIKK